MIEIRPIQKADNPYLQKIVEQTLLEFGATGDGFANSDPELKTMYEFFNKPGHAYFVLDLDSEVVGGGGIASLAGSDGSTCELQKMYFSPKARGQGMGLRLINLCMNTAKDLGYKTCYLETLDSMKAAQGLYRKIGFTQIDGPLGDTGHFGCNTFFKIDLSQFTPQL